MQVKLHTDKHIHGSAAMAAHLDQVVREALQRFGNRVTRVDAHLSDVNGHAKPGSDDIRCGLEAKLVGEEPVIVHEQAGNAHQAIAGALRKLQRALGATIEKHHDPKHQQAPLPEA